MFATMPAIRFRRFTRKPPVHDTPVRCQSQRHSAYRRAGSLRNAPTQRRQSRFSGAIAVLPLIRHAGVSEDESDEFRKTCLGSHVVRQDHDATLTLFETDHGVCGLAIVAALEETGPLRALEHDESQARMQILALLISRQVRK